MIEISDATRAVLRGPAFVRHYSIESWLGGVLLADDIPAVNPVEEGDATLRVPERLTFTVPREHLGFDWTPWNETHPLAANGQRVRVELGIGLSDSNIEWIQRGWFVIASSLPQGDSISVEAAGPLSLVDEARLVSPYQPSGTLVSTLRGLVEPAATVDVDTSLTPDRSVPADINYDDDRLGAVLELLDAWPARHRTSPEGYLEILPATLPSTPTFELRASRGGTLVEANGNTTRDAAYNVVVARGTAPDGTQIQGVAYDVVGPARFGGPFNPLPVPFFYYSPLMTSQGHCDQAAGTILARKRRETAQAWTATIVPDPTIELGDVGMLYPAQIPSGVLVSVESLTLPYAAAGGAQSLTLREVH